MKNPNIKNKLLQLFYTPYKSKVSVSNVLKELDEIEKELEGK